MGMEAGMEILMLPHSIQGSINSLSITTDHTSAESFLTTSQCTSDSTTSPAAAAVISRDYSNRTYTIVCLINAHPVWLAKLLVLVKQMMA